MLKTSEFLSNKSGQKFPKKIQLWTKSGQTVIFEVKCEQTMSCLNNLYLPRKVDFLVFGKIAASKILENKKPRKWRIFKVSWRAVRDSNPRPTGS